LINQTPTAGEFTQSCLYILATKGIQPDSITLQAAGYGLNIKASQLSLLHGVYR